MIEVKNLSKSFTSKNRKLRVLHDLNMKIESGEFVAIMGKSGSGKSTLISLLSALDHPTSGEIYVEGQRIDQLSEEALVAFRRKTIGFIFQNYNLIPILNALENVVVPAQLVGTSNALERARELLIEVGLGDRLDHFPSEMSGGEQQRVSVCRALANNPSILFGDEPTGNLDSQNSDAVMEMILKMRGQRTFIIVTHDPDLAKQADRIIEIKDGNIEANNDHSSGNQGAVG